MTYADWFKSELTTHIMSWWGKDTWPQMQSLQLLTGVWESKPLSQELVSPSRVTSFISLPYSLFPGQHKVMAPCACPQRRGPTHCGTARFLVPKDCPLPRALRTHPAKHTHYMQEHCSSASHITPSAVGKAACFPFSLPLLSPVTVPPLNTQLPSSPCLYQI